MSNSVWYGEVDLALVKLLKKIFGETVQIYFNSNRDLNNKKIFYPYIKITHLGEKFAFDRYDPNRQIVSVDTENNTSIVEDSAIPYNLSYQIDVISDSNKSNNSNTLKWASNVRAFSTLKVIDNGGVERSCFMSCQQPINLEETVSDDKVIFRHIIRATIRVEVDESTPEVVKIASKIGLNI